MLPASVRTASSRPGILIRHISTRRNAV
jgi:hypothetical protein